jgi:hypothetical protein
MSLPLFDVHPSPTANASFSIVYQPFDEPMTGLPVDVEIDGEKQSMSAMSRGQLIYVSDNN